MRTISGLVPDERLVSGSFEPLAAEPQVAQQLAKGTKKKTQTQGDEEYGERED